MKRWCAGFLALLLVLAGMVVPVDRQDVTVELFYSSAWHDVTSRVLIRDQATSIFINQGAVNEQTGVVPSDASLSMRNHDGEMNPDNRKSSLFGLIGHNTPIRISVDSDIRFSGQVVSWKPRRAAGPVSAAGGDAWVEIRAQGTIQRLGQGDPPKQSAMYRAYSTSSPTAWWPLEDSSEATQAASAVSGVGPMVLSGNGLTKFAGLSGPPGAAAAPDTSQTATAADVMVGTIPEMTGETSWRIEFSMMYRTSESIYTVDMSGWSTRGDVELWYLDQNEAGTGLRLWYIDSTGIVSAGTASSVENNDGLWHLYTITGTQDGSDIDVTVAVDGTTVISATVTGRAFGVPYEISAQAGIFATSPVATGLSHVVVWVPSSAVDTYPASVGHVPETAGARFTRLCDEEGIASTIVGTESDTQDMGPQFADTVLNWFEEIARTDAGLICDTRDELGLTLRTGRSFYNRGPAVTLDFEQGHIGIPLEPDIDDFGRINTVVAARRNGGQVTDSDTTGSLGTTAIGVYRSQVDVNTETDDVLPQHAHYHLVLGTDPDPRYPQVRVDLDVNPDLLDDLINVDVGELLSLEGIPADLGQPDALLSVSGYTEAIGSHRRSVTFNTRPGAILATVGVLDGDANACLQTAGAELDTAITAEQVSFAVATTSGPIFTTSPPSGAQIIVNDREIMTVTSIAGGASPQTFTVVRDPDQRVAHADAVSVSVYRPLRLTL